MTLDVSLSGWSLVARTEALDGAGCGLRPGLEPVSTGGTPRRAVPSRPLSYGTAANDAPMMMQPLPLGNAGVTGADGERPGHV